MRLKAPADRAPRRNVGFSDTVIRQQGIRLFDVAVGLDASRRGTHMSRMVQFVNVDLAEFNPGVPRGT